MKLKDILTLSEKKLSGLDIMLYYCLKELSVDNKMPALSQEVIPYFKQYSYRGVIKSLLRLEQHGLVTTFLNERGNREKIYFNEIEAPALVLERKIVTEPKCGIYKIYNKFNVYVGQSRNIQKRWKDHKIQINRGIHPYFTKLEAGHMKF